MEANTATTHWLVNPEDLRGMFPKFQEARRVFEREYCQKMLKVTKGNVSKAARFAGCDRKHFYEIIERCGLDVNDFRSAPNKWTIRRNRNNASGAQ